MKLNYYLLKVGKYSYVRLRYFYDGKRVDIAYPDIEVNPKDWDKENQENHIKKSDTDSIRKNRKLREIKNRYEDIIKILQIRGIAPTKDNILFFIKTQESESLPEIKINYPIVEIIDKWKNQIINNIAGKSLSYRKTVKSVTGFFIKFFNSKMGSKYRNFEDINRTFFDDYFNFCVSELNYTNDTVKKHIYTFKTFLRWSLDEKYHNTNITNYVPKMRKDLNENVFLDEKEVLAIWNFKECEYENPNHVEYTKEYIIDTRNKISGKRGGVRERIITNWELTRDMFIFSCTTGLRYSDVVKVKVNDYDYYFETLSITPQKTNKGGVNVRIPMGNEDDNILKVIWMKYSSGKSADTSLFPKTKYGNDYPNQKLNKILKEMCKTKSLLKELNRSFIKNYVKGDELVEEISGRKHLYEVISFHSGRRTFATRAMKITNNPEQVKKITGHLSDRIFNRYVGANSEDVEKLKNMWDKSKLSKTEKKPTDDTLTIELLNKKRSKGEITNEEFIEIIQKILSENK